MITETGGFIDYAELRGEALDYMHGTYDDSQLEPEEIRRIDLVVKDGMRMFFAPAVSLPGSKHKWRFLNAVVDIATEENVETMTLPEGVADVVGGLTFNGNQWLGFGPVTKRSERDIRRIHQGLALQYGVPRTYGLRWRAATGGSQQVLEMDFWPTPNAVYALRGMMTFDPMLLSPDKPVPCGSMVHAQTLKTAVKAAAEIRDKSAPGPLYQLFLNNLRGSIEYDRTTAIPDVLAHVGRGDGIFGPYYRAKEADYVN